MKLLTNIPIQKSENPINYDSNILLLGSCFAESIGDKIAYYKFDTTQNPFGILFHPKAIENLITRALDGNTYTDNDVFFSNERWYCFDAHSSVSSDTEKELLQQLNTGLIQTKKLIIEATHLVITLGTSWVYSENNTSKIVANCHKLPQQTFTKALLSTTEILESLQQICKKVRSVNNTVQLIFTVSPVRHLKDGFVENQRSKSHLITAIHQFLENNSDANAINYYPSYEIMMDELRDYRFYKSDMLHPNELAIEYIWEKFCDTHISKKDAAIMKKVATIQKGLLHRPFHLESAAHKKFEVNLQHKIADLKETHPSIKF